MHSCFLSTRVIISSVFRVKACALLLKSENVTPRCLYSTGASVFNSNNDFKLDQLRVELNNSAVESIDYEAVSEGNEEVLSRLKTIVLETDSLFQDGYNVPSNLRTQDWKHLLTLPSRNQRLKFLNFLFLKEMKKANYKAKKEANRISLEEKQKLTQSRLTMSNHIFYGLQGNTLFHRFYDSYCNKLDAFRAMNSIQLGPHIIMDCDYYDYQNMLEQKMLAKQFLFVLGENRTLYEPYNIIFSGFDPESILAKQLNSTIPNLYSDEFPFNYTDKSITELGFNRHELVYLSPHSNQVLLEHTPGSVYIIGGMVDKRIQQPISLAKAKKLGIRSAKLPLDNYLDWGTGHKSLTINQIVAIMNDWRLTNDWNYAFRHIPRRKLFRDEIDNESYLGKKDDTSDEAASGKLIKQRKKKQLVYELLLKR